MLSVGKKRVLIAPLDWGLGHATRCIPIIKALLNADYEVIIASEGKTKALLLQEFPNLTFLPLEGYKINYSRTRLGLFFKILLQIPKILRVIREENKWLQAIIDTYKLDLILSDNRYGLYNKKVYSIFITHQLRIRTPLSAAILQSINYRLLRNFNEIWVPDLKETPGLAGALSHPKKLPLVPITFIGLLSRLNFNKGDETKHHLLILLSGPEPQRTILENLLLGQLKHYAKPVLLIRGLPGERKSPSSDKKMKIINHLPAVELETAFAQASYIICRSGYSSVMDIIKMRKKSILVPTPGQTEQEYLAHHLSKNKLAFCIKQNDFELSKALAQAETFPYRFYEEQSSVDLENAVLKLATGKT